ncbi:MAG TPA: SH3 domain-containing protein [Oleiagrimonas sp.]|nr:SH3 domain-containing protein [Oleiagrimonas sp.]
MRFRFFILVATLLSAAAVTTPSKARASDALPLPPHGVIGVEAAQLTPEFWLARLQHPDRVIMDDEAVAAYDARVVRLDPYVYDLKQLPSTLDGNTLTKWIRDVSSLPSHPRYDVHGKRVPQSRLDGLVTNLALDAVPDQVHVRYGLVVHRALLRGFPTTLRVFSDKGETDIDRFQESAMVPGTPVAVLHTSRDGKWYFVEAPRYRAWVQAKYIAIGTAAEVFNYVQATPFRVVTAASVRTVFTREQPAVSKLQLDMGTRVPFAPGWPADKPVNGQGPYASHVIKLPLRKTDGSLAFTHALLQKNTGTLDHYLPLTRANIIRQAFKFLGERYGWGSSYDGRDCSGFVSDVYRSMGIVMPRNTSAQSVSPAANLTAFDESSTHAERMQAVRDLQVGDLIYIPGHVMMMIGRFHGQPYVIHDVLGATFLDANDKLHHIKLNQVSVTPLLPLLIDKDTSFVDVMTSIVRIRPAH